MRLLELYRSFVNLIYPPLCVHCSEVMHEGNVILCDVCTSLLEMLDPADRCPKCFSSHYAAEARKCGGECSKYPWALTRVSAAFEYDGPAATIIKRMKYGNEPHLSKGAGAFLVAQWMKMEWPEPDFIVPMPISFMHWFDRGYNQSALLANEVGALLGVPIVEPIKRSRSDFSQAGLELHQREQLPEDAFILKKKHQSLVGKKVLLIDDVYTTGSTMRRAAEALTRARPSDIYGLTFCRV